MHRPRVLRTTADLHGQLHLAQSLAHDGDLLAPTRLGSAAIPQQTDNGRVCKLGDAVGENDVRERFRVDIRQSGRERETSCVGCRVLQT